MPDKKSIYWLSRAMADEARAQRIADGASEEIRQMYRRQYLKVVQQLTNLKAELDAGRELTRTQLWNYSRWSQLEEELKSFVTESTRFNINETEKALNEVFEKTIGATAESFSRSRMTLPISAHDVINTTWSGERYSARIWKNQAAIADRLKNSMEDMLVQGRGLPDIKKQIMKEFNVAYNDADRLVRTEAAYVLNRANVAKYRQAGLKKVEWSVGPEDGRECAVCAARGGKVYLIDEAPIIPAHPRCRCIYAGVVELSNEDVEVDGPAADAALEAAQQQKKLQKAAGSGIIKQESELGKFKKNLSADERVDKEYYSKLKTKFSHGSDDAKTMFNQYANGDTVADSNYINTPRFNPKTKKIYMNYAADADNVRGNGATYFHEHAHLIDDARGYISHDKKFNDCLEQDAKNYRIQYGKKHSLGTWNKVDAAISADLNTMRKHSAVSDILGAVTKGNISGIAGHADSYWNENSICEEAFAHMFECQFDSVRYKEMQKYFPSALNYFEEKMLKKGM